MNTEHPAAHDDEYVTKKELAVRLKVSVRTVEQWQHVIDNHSGQRLMSALLHQAGLLAGDHKSFFRSNPACYRPELAGNPTFRLDTTMA